MDLSLDLNNFDSPEAEGSRYVLTSPRSLEACARMKVRPVQLLPKPLEDFMDENPGKPLPLLQVFHDNHELKRVELLQKCRELRQTIIMEKKVQRKKKEKKEEGSEDVSWKSKNRTAKDKLSQDENNNSTNSASSDHGSHARRKQLKPSITPRKFGQPLTPGHATFTKTKSKSEVKEDPYMISTPVLPKKRTVNVTPTRSLGRMDRMAAVDGDSSPRSRPISGRLTERKRSRSVDVWKRRSRPNSEIELASSLKFANSKFLSGTSTPQQQKDQKIIEAMKGKRKQQEDDAKRISEKQKEWDEIKRKEERKRHEEQLAKERSLKQSHLEWEKRIKEKEEKRVRELKRNEVEKQRIIEETEKQIEMKKKEQERLQRELIDERRRTDKLKKQQQKAAKQTVENDIKAFQEATERELDDKLGKAQKTKLELEMKELSKLQFLNKSQREKFLRLGKELKRKNQEEVDRKRVNMQEKLEKAEVLRHRKVTEREHALKLQAKEEDERIQKTKEKQKEIDQKNDQYMQSIAENKKEQLLRANSTFLHNIQSKSKRAQQIRETSQDEQKRRMKIIEKEEEKYLAETKEHLEAKDMRSKTHQQLKEAAIQMSRANARAAEAARSEVKQKDDTFLEAHKHAAMIMSIGRGPRTGLVNTSSVKFG